MTTATQEVAGLRLYGEAPCVDAIAWLEQHPDWTMADAWRECHRADWMLWYVRAAGVEIDDHSLRVLAVEWRERACRLWAKRSSRPLDARSEHALSVAWRYLRGQATREELRAARSAAAAAAYAAADADAAYADAYAAYTAADADAAYAAAAYAAAYAAADADAAYAAAAYAAAYAAADADAAYAAAAYAAAYAAEWREMMRRQAERLRQIWSPPEVHNAGR